MRLAFDVYTSFSHILWKKSQYDSDFLTALGNECFQKHNCPFLLEIDLYSQAKTLFYSSQDTNGWLSASDLFDIFTQLIKFYYTFHYRILKAQIF